MSSDDLYFLDVLSSIPNDVRRYSLEVADAIDRNVEILATSLRETLSSSPWIPPSARPLPPPKYSPPPELPSYYDNVRACILRNRKITTAILISVGALSFLVYRRRRAYGRKRRARRASNGARSEVVVVSGSPGEPICRSVSLDLERRGFMVYLVANSLEDEQAIQNLSRSDIRPLNIGIVDPTSTINAIERFKQILTHPQHAFPGATAHHVSLAGVLIIPDMSYPSGPVETVAPDLWWDALNVRVLGSVTTVQAFLQTICDFDARLLILTPSIIPSLSPPFHSVESAIVAALNAFSRSLSAELDPLGVAVCQLKLGTFDCGGVGGRQHLQPGNATRADVLSWPSSARAAYAKNYIAQSISAGNRGCVGLQSNGVRGSQLRALHNSVFDAMTVQRPRKVWHVGSGSLMYDTVGRWVPSGLITWMLGIRKVSRNELRDLEPADWGTVERMA